MSKALSVIILIMMGLHLWRPFGLPGLRKRKDVWKIAVAALVAIALTTLLSHNG